MMQNVCCKMYVGKCMLENVDVLFMVLNEWFEMHGVKFLVKNLWCKMYGIVVNNYRLLKWKFAIFSWKFY